VGPGPFAGYRFEPAHGRFSASDERGNGQPAGCLDHFDEMDYRLAFESPANARLPEFRALAQHGLYATNAYPPGGRTVISVPALLSGRLVTSSKEAGLSSLYVTYAGAAGAAPWTTDQTVFDVERRNGWRTAIAGWYFPYSRIFGHDIDAWGDQSRRLGLNPSRAFLDLMADQLRVMAEGRSESMFGTSLSVLEHERLVTEVVAEAIRKAADPNLDLVFLHLPVPHGPFYYDARTGRTSTRPLGPSGYLDHLQLGDHVLGRIREAIDESGAGRRTTLLVSSDHWNRRADLIDGRIDHRVPFLVSFPGDSRGVKYASPFNTVLTRRLVTAILEGSIRNGRAAARWLEQEKGPVAESPYNGN